MMSLPWWLRPPARGAPKSSEKLTFSWTGKCSRCHAGSPLGAIGGGTGSVVVVVVLAGRVVGLVVVLVVPAAPAGAAMTAIGTIASATPAVTARRIRKNVM